VDGREVPVLRANLAYKALRLPAGAQCVEFHFDDPLYRGLYLFWGVLALGWITFLLVVTFRCVVKDSLTA
jgi:hypothetical protein